MTTTQTGSKLTASVRRAKTAQAENKAEPAAKTTPTANKTTAQSATKRTTTRKTAAQKADTREHESEVIVPMPSNRRVWPD